MLKHFGSKTYKHYQKKNHLDINLKKQLKFGTDLMGKKRLKQNLNAKHYGQLSHCN